MRDGKVTFEELVVITVQRKESLVDKTELRKIFRKYDTDKDGVLNRDELEKALKSIGDKSLTKDVDELLEEFDTNHDGVIQFDEFMKMMAD
ncbi:hypothetical protein KUTeg_013677 [Tegillarca granosa]|uniref:EF-hand domain-containing protein n=1 Tax=Tegillarca granosa TaxID=220873 RepID=A0ABQ9EZT4_TEGGR|nr:hypothetical protein KUTeg_013677 [Tegillarca granosa]